MMVVVEVLLFFRQEFFKMFVFDVEVECQWRSILFFAVDMRAFEDFLKFLFFSSFDNPFVFFQWSSLGNNIAMHLMQSELFFEFGVFDFQLLAPTQKLFVGWLAGLLNVDRGVERIEIEGVGVFWEVLIAGRLPIEIAVHVCFLFNYKQLPNFVDLYPYFTILFTVLVCCSFLFEYKHVSSSFSWHPYCNLLSVPYPKKTHASDGVSSTSRMKK